MEELALLLSKAGLQDQYVLVGHSFGGWNMRLFACQHPEHVVGVVLVDAAPEDQSTRLPRLPFRQRLRQQAESMTAGPPARSGGSAIDFGW